MSPTWPPWWEWELELSPHVWKRMEDRGFNEVELRDMLERAEDYREDVVEGRWVVSTSHAHLAWEVIVEPDYQERKLVIVTAYGLGD